jgi:hypothetical protein
MQAYGRQLVREVGVRTDVISAQDETQTEARCRSFLRLCLALGTLPWDVEEEQGIWEPAVRRYELLDPGLVSGYDALTAQMDAWRASNPTGTERDYHVDYSTPFGTRIF